MAGVLVKVCGVTNVEDARWAVNFGADFIGLNFARKSPRMVSPEKAGEIVSGLPGFAKSVGVFVDPDLDFLTRVLAGVKLSVLQFHGVESPEFLGEIKAAFNLPVWKAVRVQEASSLAQIELYQNCADQILLDAYSPDLAGGTGEVFNWDLAVEAKKFNVPIILAGGLTPLNVADAVRQVRPHGVDAASGVEKTGRPKKKDMDKMRAFVEAAKGVKL